MEVCRAPANDQGVLELDGSQASIPLWTPDADSEVFQR